MTQQQTETSPFPPGHPDAPPAPVAALPTGMAWGIAADGSRIPVYLPPEPDGPRENAPPQQRDVWPLRMATGGGSIAAVLAAVGYAGPHLTEAGHAAEMAGVGVAATCAGIGGLVLLLGGSFGRKSEQNVNVHVNISNSVSASARSRSGRRR
jgi:hypothetical protein